MRKTRICILTLLLLLLTGCASQLGGTFIGTGEPWGLSDCSTELSFLDGDMTISLESAVISDIFPGQYRVDSEAGTIELSFEEPGSEAFSGTYTFRETESGFELNGFGFQKQ